MQRHRYTQDKIEQWEQNIFDCNLSVNPTAHAAQGRYRAGLFKRIPCANVVVLL